ncbi:hypothetical protein CO666_28055 [Rhizobium chutanense]|uniref:Uncharacterized protein n=1 Tax=Rhizobium chutanense TaxID=2035448 RepID=A0A2A6J4R5_9HYPH|nr:hypothetical protein CO666_28055 [Rhizobium chutanense]
MSFGDDLPQLQADASEADSAVKTEAATKTATRYEFIEIPHSRGSNLARADAQHHCRFVGIEAMTAAKVVNCDHRPLATQQ